MDWRATLLNGTVIAALIGLVEVLLRRHWDKKDRTSGIAAQIAGIDQKLAQHMKEDEEYKMECKRARILQFNKEIREHDRHSEEEFIEILKVIDEYESFCRTHDDFLNNRAGAAIANTKSTYQKINRSNDFEK